MLDIALYPECLECECPDFGDSGSTVASYFMGEDVIYQRLACAHERVCKRIRGDKIDFTPYIEEAREPTNTTGLK